VPSQRHAAASFERLLLSTSAAYRRGRRSRQHGIQPCAKRSWRLNSARSTPRPPSRCASGLRSAPSPSGRAWNATTSSKLACGGPRPSVGCALELVPEELRKDLAQVGVEDLVKKMLSCCIGDRTWLSSFPLGLGKPSALARLRLALYARKGPLMTPLCGQAPTRTTARLGQTGARRHRSALYRRSPSSYAASPTAGAPFLQPSFRDSVYTAGTACRPR
jgi:hypothetical protein